jgi:hypothetical protein
MINSYSLTALVSCILFWGIIPITETVTTKADLAFWVPAIAAYVALVGYSSWRFKTMLHNDHVNPSKGMHVLIFFTPVIVFLLVNAIRN